MFHCIQISSTTVELAHYNSFIEHITFMSILRYTKIIFCLNLQYMKENYKKVEGMTEMPLPRSQGWLGTYESSSLYLSISTSNIASLAFQVRTSVGSWSFDLITVPFIMSLRPFLCLAAMVRTTFMMGS